MRKRVLILVLLTACGVVLAGCGPKRITLDDLFPAQVGNYLRLTGPALEADTGVNVATYSGPEGAITLRVKEVGRDHVSDAVNGLPPLATNVTDDPALGVRDGVFFDFAGEFHAAWGNGNWVFVISASTDSARRAFIAGYGY